MFDLQEMRSIDLQTSDGFRYGIMYMDWCDDQLPVWNWYAYPPRREPSIEVSTTSVELRGVAYTAREAETKVLEALSRVRTLNNIIG